ncbi:MAG: ankyrin repeat domain-containing protein [Bacteroidales bacterium]
MSLFLVPALSQTVQTLILQDTSYTFTDPEYELLSAASSGDTTKLLAFLEIGTDVNTTTYDGVTPLMFAAQNGYLRMVEILIDSGANINLKPYNQIDALLSACIAGHVEVADTLILNGANINTRNLDGVTPLMYAAAYDNYLLADVLIFYNAKIDANDNSGNTALHLSSFYGNYDISVLLAENGAIIDSQDINGFTPLMIAAQNGHPDLVQYLYEKGADINKSNSNNLNALSLAILNKNINVVEFLISNGANVNYEISQNLNSTGLAKEYSSKKLYDVMVKAGGKPARKMRWESIVMEMDMSFNGNDFMMGGNLGLYEAKNRLVFELGYKTRPSERSVLYEYQSNIYYQFWEKRSVFHFGAAKQFRFKRFNLYEQAGAYAGLNGGYTYGNFRGSDKKPDDRFLLIPKAGFYYYFKAFSMSAGYEYMKLNNTKVSPHRVSISLGAKINLTKDKIKLKKEPLL